MFQERSTPSLVDIMTPSPHEYGSPQQYEALALPPHFIPDQLQRSGAVTAAMFYTDVLIPFTETLEGSGSQVRIIGGTARDLLMGVVPNDFDLKIARISFPELLTKAESMGTILEQMSHIGWVKVQIGDQILDMTIPLDYTITPDKPIRTVNVKKSVEDSSHYLDFTVNALLINPLTNNVESLFGGLSALSERRVVAISPLLFSRNPSALIRAIRTADKIDGIIDPKTGRMIQHSSRHVARMDDGWIAEEWRKTFLDAHSLVAVLQTAKDLNLIDALYNRKLIDPTLPRITDDPIWSNTIDHFSQLNPHQPGYLQASDNDWINILQNLSMPLFHMTGSQANVEVLLQSFGVDNNIISKAVHRVCADNIVSL